MSANKVAQDFIKAINTQKQKPSAYDTKGEVMRITEGIAWVHLAGGIDETPCELTIGASVGDTVQVRVAGGRAWLVGNSTEPPVGDKHVQNIIKKEKKNIVKEVEEDTTTIINQKIENISVDDPRVIKVSHDPIITHHSVTITADEMLYNSSSIGDRYITKMSDQTRAVCGKITGSGAGKSFRLYDYCLVGQNFALRKSYRGLPVNFDVRYKVGANAFATPTSLVRYWVPTRNPQTTYNRTDSDLRSGWTSQSIAESSLKSLLPSFPELEYDKSGMLVWGGYYRTVDFVDGAPRYSYSGDTLAFNWNDESFVNNGSYDSEHYFTPQSPKDGGVILAVKIPNNNVWTMSFIAYGEVFDIRGFSGLQFDFDLVKL